MKENELRYYFPYSIEKAYNFRELMANKELLNKLEPEYERILENDYYVSRIKDFDKNQYNLTRNKYIKENYNNWLNWYKNGRNIFSFSKELLQMLEKTDVGDVTYQSFNLPYDNFYISLKPLEIPVSNDNAKIIDGVYVSVDRLAMENTFKEEHPLIYLYAISFDFVGDFEEMKLKFYDKIWDSYGDGIGGVNFWNYSFYFIDDEAEAVLTIEDAVSDAKKMFKSSYFPENAEEIEDCHLDAYNYQIDFIERTCKVLINSLLYLSLPKEVQEIKESYPVDLPHNYNKKISFSANNSDRKKVERKISENGFSKIKFVGSSFKDNIRNNFNRENELSPHWRRGHWRNQPFGVALAEAKLIWIKPTIVNKENGEPQKGHIYTTE